MMTSIGRYVCARTLATASRSIAARLCTGMMVVTRSGIIAGSLAGSGQRAAGSEGDLAFCPLLAARCPLESSCAVDHLRGLRRARASPARVQGTRVVPHDAPQSRCDGEWG